MILLVTGSSTEPTLFHVGCRPSLHVGLLQHLYLINTWSKKGSSFLSGQHMIEDRYCTYIWSTHDWRKARPTLTSDLLFRKARLALTSDHVGTNPIIISERPNTYIWSTHDQRKASTSLFDQHMIKDRYCTYIWSTHDRIKAHHFYLINTWSKIDTALTSDQYMIEERHCTYI